MDWQLAAEIATTVSTIAVAASAIVVVMQLRQAARERYFTVTSHLFEIWQSPEFQHDQLFLLHKLSGTSWEEFCAMGRGDHPERAIHRVGGYYDRVGNLVRHGLIRKDDILPTIGGYAVAVWHRIEPLVKELRLRENAVLFENYEALLPECQGCYVPGIDVKPVGVPTAATIVGTNAESCALPEQPVHNTGLINGALRPEQSFTPERFTRSTTEMAIQNSTIDSGAAATMQLSLPDTDGIVHKLSEFTGSGPAVLVYARGAWCPFCLRQLADYAERYGEFKSSGIEVVAVSPESPRISRRMRTQLKLPFAVLSDAKLEAAKSLGLMDHEKLGEPTPATLVLDGAGHVQMSTLNEGAKSVFARDTFDYVLALKQGTPAASVPAPKVESPKPGFLFFKALANKAASLVIR